MVSKLFNDVKYFLERIFARDGKPLLMLCIIGIVLAVLEIIVFLGLINNATKLNIPFLLLYTYALYFLNRLFIRGIQTLLIRFNIIKYKEDNFNYVEDDMSNRIRRYNNSIYIKERDRYESTIIYIITLVVFFLIILTVVLNADNIVKIIIALLLLVPFFLLLKEPYEIVSIDVNEQDKRDMTKKDFIEELLDKIFKEKQITSPLDLPSATEMVEEPINNYSEIQYYEQEQQYYNQLNQEQLQEYNRGEQTVDYPQYQNTYAEQNPNINNQMDNNQQISGQWWQQ